MRKSREYLDHLASTIDALDCDAIDRAVAMIGQTWRGGKHMYSFGNGGSAVTASHLITDLNKTLFLCGGHPFHGACLNDNIGLLTAIANDIAYAEVFAQQVKSVVREGDLVLAISGSGNSPNILRGIQEAKQRGASTIGLCGFDGGALKPLVDVAVHVPVNDMQIVEDLHLSFVHIALRVLCSSNESTTPSANGGTLV